MNESQELQKTKRDDKETGLTKLGSESQTPTLQEIVQRYLPDVEWMDETRGRAPCPGRHKHTSRSHKNDCWVFINGVPTVSCLHDSCREEIGNANSDIRAAFNLFNPELDPVAMAAAKERAAKRHALEAKAKASLPEILKQYSWDYGCLLDASEKRFPFKTQTVSFLNYMFSPLDIIWIGEPMDSGRPEHDIHFMDRANWECHLPTKYRYTTASTYKLGYSRSNDNVLKTPFMIVEGDKILGEPKTDEEKLQNKNACGAIFRWLESGCGLVLRAVVDAGNRSLHGWYEMPSLAQFEEFKVVLPALGCDRAMFKPSQPARLPGVIRENGKEQRLLYLK